MTEEQATAIDWLTGFGVKMTITDWLTILAIFLGPIVAVQLTKHLDARKEKRQRKLDIFKTLMETSDYTISMDHVKALNRIDLEFEKSIPQEKEVIDAWKQYLDLLCDKAISGDVWGTKRIELLIELLHKMSLVLGYDFDKTHIKNATYSPVAHGDMELQQVSIRKGLIDILEGRRWIPIHEVGPPEHSQTTAQNKAPESLLKQPE